MAELINGELHAESIGIQMVAKNLSINTDDLDIEHSGFLCVNNTKGSNINITGAIRDRSEEGIIHQLVLLNVSDNNIVISNNSDQSASGNRFFTKTGADLTLGRFEGATFYGISTGDRFGWQEI